MLTPLLILAGCYVLACAAIGLGQRRFIYFPTKAPPETLAQWAGEAGLQPWLDAAGRRIGWKRFSPAVPACGQILIAHGNAGCAVDRGHYAQALQPVAPLDVFLLEYPGYADRAGAPSERSLCQAAEEAFSLLATNVPVYLIGESLGSGVAAFLAGRHPERIAGVLLLAPYHNFADLAQRHMPAFPVRWMLRDRYPSETHLRSYRGPLAVLLAGRDEVVPNEFGRRLYDAYGGPKRIWVDEPATHNAVYEQPRRFWEEVIAFWRDAPTAPRSESR